VPSKKAEPMSPLIATRVSLLVSTAAAIVASSVSSPPTREHSPPTVDVAKIQRAVSVCANFVRTLPEGYWGAEEFDAYYNTVTGRVLRLGTPQAAIQFDKCMAGQGVPLR
jgi:hypothetical protein